jgi:hypothetical protein
MICLVKYLAFLSAAFNPLRGSADIRTIRIRPTSFTLCPVPQKISQLYTALLISWDKFRQIR